MHMSQSGKPWEIAELALDNPIIKLKHYSQYFDTFDGVNIANICGSCGKKAIPLAILG
jgi:hypothetical protein